MNVISCSKILGKNLTRLVKAGITIFQIACIIIALIKGMTILLPALMSKDADKGDKSTGQLIVLGIVLIIALIFRPIVALLGKILEFDVSCII